MNITGTSSDDTLTGTSGNDLFKVYQGGNDTVSGLGGNDVFNFGATLTAADKVDGGSGNDTVELNGDYSTTLTFGATTMVNVEAIKLAAGFDYALTTNDATVAAGATLTVDASALGAANHLTFDGSLETDGNFRVEGGAGDDTVTMGAHLVATDSLNGGGGSDTLFLGGNYSLTFHAATLTSIDDLVLFGGSHTYRFTTNDANVAAGAILQVDSSSLGASDSLIFNGSKETDGAFNFDGSTALLQLTGGAQSDTFFMGADLKGNDRLNGEGGSDVVYLNGDYSLALKAATLKNIENISLNGAHNYHITTAGDTGSGANFFTVDASQVDSANTVYFNAAKETSDRLFYINGAEQATVVGTAQSDTFDFTETGSAFSTADRIDGGGGSDVLNLAGDYFGTHALTLTNTTVTNVGEFDLAGGFDCEYNITLAAGTVAAGASLLVDASAAVGLTFDGSAASSTSVLHVIGSLGVNTLTDGAGNDILVGGSGDGANTFNMLNGGNDTVTGGQVDDIINFGSQLTATDRVDGGAGFDVLNLSGDYTGAHALVLGATAVVNVEEIELATGHSYSITSNDATVASGGYLDVDGEFLDASDTLTFDGSAETNGIFIIIGGHGDDVITGGAGGDDIVLSGGGNDTVHGGGGNDTIDFDGALTAADTIDGEAGNDTLALQGNYSAGLTLGATTLTSVETISLSDNSSNYKITTNDANVAAGQTLTVDASPLLDSIGALIFDGSAETDGTFVLIGSRGNDILTGGAGNDTMSGGTNGNDTFTGGGGADLIELGARSHNDTLIYHAVSDSTSVTYDTVQQLDFSTDVLKISAAGTAPSAIDAAVNSGTLSTASFDANLAAAIGASHLAAHQAVLFTPNAGTLAGHAFLVVDMNGVAGYQASADLVFDVTGFSGTLTTTSFS